jgi:multisubunit Na+/H+ antiporter MnhE subunit
MAEYENVSKTIHQAIDNTITEEYIKSKIDSIYGEKAISEAKRKDIITDFENLSYRINGELTRLRKSANLNLVIGTLTTICAIMALGYEVFNNDLIFSDATKVLSHYIPRISLIVFVEIFAFFFLKLYKATLSDIKYFNNEKTNVDFKIVSLKTALNTSDLSLIKTMLEELIKTERNFKLGKNESTVELEKIKNDAISSHVIAQLLESANNKKMK